MIGTLDFTQDPQGRFGIKNRSRQHSLQQHPSLGTVKAGASSRRRKPAP
jgi:hypothetical protein